MACGLGVKLQGNTMEPLTVLTGFKASLAAAAVPGSGSLTGKHVTVNPEPPKPLNPLDLLTPLNPLNSNPGTPQSLNDKLKSAW